jgi:hypothetical protein
VWKMSNVGCDQTGEISTPLDSYSLADSVDVYIGRYGGEMRPPRRAPLRSCRAARQRRPPPKMPFDANSCAGSKYVTVLAVGHLSVAARPDLWSGAVVQKLIIGGK